MILITGAAGFIGRRAVRAFADAGHTVRALVRRQPTPSLFPLERVEVTLGDVTDSPPLNSALSGVDTVINLAAVIREQGRNTFQAVNHRGARNLIDASIQTGVRRFIHASALGVSSDPSSPYLYSRWMAEEEIKRSDLDSTILRFSLGFGEGDEFFNRLAALIKVSPLVPVFGDGTTVFQPIAADDVAMCLVRAYEDKGTIGQSLDVAGPEKLTYDETMDLIAEILSSRIVKVHVPLSMARPAVKLMEWLLPRPPITGDQLGMLTKDLTTDPDSVEKSFGFNPTPIRGNIDYIRRIGFLDTLKMNLGSVPGHIRDH